MYYNERIAGGKINIKRGGTRDERSMEKEDKEIEGLKEKIRRENR